jgi:hypothetical protein
VLCGGELVNGLSHQGGVIFLSQFDPHDAAGQANCGIGRAVGDLLQRAALGGVDFGYGPLALAADRFLGAPLLLLQVRLGRLAGLVEHLLHLLRGGCELGLVLLEDRLRLAITAISLVELVRDALLALVESRYSSPCACATAGATATTNAASSNIQIARSSTRRLL